MNETWDLYIFVRADMQPWSCGTCRAFYNAADRVRFTKLKNYRSDQIYFSITKMNEILRFDYVNVVVI